MTVTADNKSKDYGEANPSLTKSYSGNVSGETPAFTGLLTTSATTNSDAGTYDITKGTLALANNDPFLASNYTMSFTKGTLTINKLDLAAPTGLSITKGGTVSWNAVTGATNYQYKVTSDDSWHSVGNVTSVNLLSEITADSDDKTIFVRATNTGASASPNYSSPGESASKAVVVYQVQFSSTDTNLGTVDTSAYNVISGVTYTASSNKILLKAGNTTIKTVTASPKTKKGYTNSFSSWDSTSGTIDHSGVEIKASFTNYTAKTYKVTYSSGAATNVSGSMANTTGITYNTSFTLRANAFTSSDAYVFYKWSDSSSATSYWPNSFSGNWEYDNGDYGISSNTLSLTARWRRYASCEDEACGISSYNYTIACIRMPTTVSTCPSSGTAGTYGNYGWNWYTSNKNCSGYTMYNYSGASSSSHGSICYMRRVKSTNYKECRTSGCGWQKDSSGNVKYY